MTCGFLVAHGGVAQGEELSSAYASADVFVMPSESETLGFVVLEAMASQLPVVAVRAGGIPDIITPQDNGASARRGEGWGGGREGGAFACTSLQGACAHGRLTGECSSLPAHLMNLRGVPACSVELHADA